MSQLTGVLAAGLGGKANSTATHRYKVTQGNTYEGLVTCACRGLAVLRPKGGDFSARRRRAALVEHVLHAVHFVPRAQGSLAQIPKMITRSQIDTI